MRPREWVQRRLDLVLALALLILPFLVLGRALLPGRVLSAADNVVLFTPWAAQAPGVTPANPLLLDITFLFQPSVVHAAEEIRAGHFPLWNPFVFGGVPFFANPQTAVLFPLTALAYVLPVPLALGLMAVLKLSVAGVGMYWFLRRLAVSPGPAGLGALSFMLNALLITWLQWSNTGTVILLPVLFGVTEVLRERGGARPVAWLALVVALSVFAGYPQRVAYGLLALGVWALYRARGAPRPLGFLAGWAGGVALGGALAAVQLLPFAEYAQASAVLGYRQEWTPYFPLPLRALGAVLMPYFFGSPTGRDFWGPMNFNEISLSVGVVPWLALPLALAAARTRRAAAYFLAVAALAAALVYGLPGVAEGIAGIPPLSRIIIVRVADLLVFSLSVLCGLGLDAIARGSVPTRRARDAVRAAALVLGGGAFALVASEYALAARTAMRVPLAAQYVWFLAQLTLAALLLVRLLGGTGARPRAWLALAAVQLAGLLPVAVSYNPVLDTRLFYPGPPPVVQWLRAESARDQARVLFPAFGAANFGTIFRLPEMGGYDGMTPRRIEQVVDPAGSLDSWASGALRVTAGFSSPAFDLLGIRYVVLAPRSASPAPHFTLAYEGPDALAYRNDRALPRAFLAFRARTCVDEAAALRLIGEGGVDFRQEVLVAGCGDAPAVGPPGVGRAAIREYAAERVVIDVTTDTPAYLVLTDAWFPGWRAWTDGREQPIQRADHAFRAVWVPPGTHEIEFRYTPASFRYGLLLSGAAALAVAGALVLPAVRRRA